MLRPIVKIFVFFGIFFWVVRPSFAVESGISVTNTFNGIWKYNTQSLSNIWFGNNNDLTFNSTSDISPTNASDIEETNKIIAQNRLFLEQLSHKPVVKVLNGDSETLGLKEKLEKTKTTAANIYSGIQNLKSRSQLLAQKWPGLTDSEIKSELTILSSIFTQDTTQKDSNILSSTNWLKTSWDHPTIVNIVDETQSAQSQIENLLNDLITSGKVNNTSILEPALSHITKLDQLIGSSLALSTDPSLFGFIRKTSDQIALLDKQAAEATRILTDLNENPSMDQTIAIDRLKKEIIASNLLTNANLFLTATTDSHSPTNQVLSFLALIDSNKLLLAGNTGQIIKHVWIEEGNVVFRIMVSNLSRTQIQTANVKFLLPSELKPEQVLSHDSQLLVISDSTENALVASGDILLAPLETRTFTVEVEDIWSFNPGEIESLKSQVNMLARSLKNTTGYDKGEPLERDILSGLEKLLLKHKQSITPESRIVSFREASITLNGIEQKISSLKLLLFESKSNENILGITTETQAVSLQGIFSLIVASLAFTILYINALKSQPISKKSARKDSPTGTKFDNSPTHVYYHQEKSQPKLSRMAKIVIITLISGGLGSMGTSLIIRSASIQSKKQDLTKSDVRVLGTSTKNINKKFPYEVSIFPPKQGTIPVRKSPSITSPQIRSLNESKVVPVFKTLDHWVMIVSSDSKSSNDGWWINDTFIEKN